MPALSLLSLCFPIHTTACSLLLVPKRSTERKEVQGQLLLPRWKAAPSHVFVEGPSSYRCVAGTLIAAFLLCLHKSTQAGKAVQCTHPLQSH